VRSSRRAKRRFGTHIAVIILIYRMSPSNRAFVQLALLGLLCGPALASEKTSVKTRALMEADGKLSMTTVLGSNGETDEFPESPNNDILFVQDARAVASAATVRDASLATLQTASQSAMMRRQDDLNLQGEKASSLASEISQTERSKEAQDKPVATDAAREIEEAAEAVKALQRAAAENGEELSPLQKKIQQLSGASMVDIADPVDPPPDGELELVTPADGKHEVDADAQKSSLPEAAPPLDSSKEKSQRGAEDPYGGPQVAPHGSVPQSPYGSAPHPYGGPQVAPHSSVPQSPYGSVPQGPTAWPPQGAYGGSPHGPYEGLQVVPIGQGGAPHGPYGGYPQVSYGSPGLDGHQGGAYGAQGGDGNGGQGHVAGDGGEQEAKFKSEFVPCGSDKSGFCLRSSASLFRLSPGLVLLLVTLAGFRAP